MKSTFLLILSLIIFVGCDHSQLGEPRVKMENNEQENTVETETEETQKDAKSSLGKCHRLSLHPKVKAECFAYQLITQRENDDVNILLEELEQDQFKLATIGETIENSEVVSAYVQGHCLENGTCNWTYMVPIELSRYENIDKFSESESVILYIKASTSEEETQLVKATTSLQDLI
jgi:hypothetical protein